jgi:hypothetical protein
LPARSSLLYAPRFPVLFCHLLSFSSGSRLAVHQRYSQSNGRASSGPRIVQASSRPTFTGCSAILHDPSHCGFLQRNTPRCELLHPRQQTRWPHCIKEKCRVGFAIQAATALWICLQRTRTIFFPTGSNRHRCNHRIIGCRRRVWHYGHSAAFETQRRACSLSRCRRPWSSGRGLSQAACGGSACAAAVFRHSLSPQATSHGADVCNLPHVVAAYGNTVADERAR